VNISCEVASAVEVFLIRLTCQTALCLYRARNNDNGQFTDSQVQVSSVAIRYAYARKGVL
jgi:hypothetical protein